MTAEQMGQEAGCSDWDRDLVSKGKNSHKLIENVLSRILLLFVLHWDSTLLTLFAVLLDSVSLGRGSNHLLYRLEFQLRLIDFLHLLDLLHLDLLLLLQDLLRGFGFDRWSSHFSNGVH